MILCSVNQNGELTANASETIRQGMSPRICVSAPYNSGTCRLVIWRPLALTPLYEDISISLYTTDGQKLYSFDLPTSVTVKAGKVNYQFFFNDAGTVTSTTVCSFTVTEMQSFVVPAHVEDFSGYTIAQLHALLIDIDTKLGFYNEQTGKIDISGDLEADGTATIQKIVSPRAVIDRCVVKQTEHDAQTVTSGGFTYYLLDLIKVGNAYKITALRLGTDTEQLVIGDNNNAVQYYPNKNAFPIPLAGTTVYGAQDTDKYYVCNDDVVGYVEIQKIVALCPTTWRTIGGQSAQVSDVLVNDTSVVDVDGNANIYQPIYDEV